MTQNASHIMEEQKKHSILIVDDDPAILEAFSTFFKREDFNVMTAKNGWEGEVIFRKNPTDVVITDVNMPKKDGIDLTLSLKTDFPKTLIAVITGGGHWDADYSLRASKVMGATIALNKPVNHKELLNKIKRYLIQN